MLSSTVGRTASRIPASLFGIVLGLAGLAANWRAAHAAWGLPAIIGEALYAIAASAWLAIAVLFALKWLVARPVAKEEASHPVQCCFIGLAGVATMLVALGSLPYSRPLSIGLFTAGALYSLGFALWRTGLLWRGGRDASTSTPVLYLPMVAGGFVTGTVGAALGWTDWARLAFGAGAFAWLAIESVLLHRLYTAPPMPPAMRPTLGIQMAPPAVGAVCWLSVNGGHADALAYALLGYGLVQALLVARMAPWIREQPFAPSYWAFTFGATALAGATLRASLDAPAGGALRTLAPVLFVMANLLIAAIAAGTLRLALRGRLLAPPATIPAP